MEEPSFNMIDEEGEPREFDRHHAYLYTFIGEKAIYDHVFLLTDDPEDGIPTAHYLWKIQPGNLEIDPLYEVAADYLKDNDFPCCLNGHSISQQDLEVFDWQFGVNELHDADTYPQDWNDLPRE